MVDENFFTWGCVGLEDTEFPDLPCPACGSPSVYDRDSLIRYETAASRPRYEEYVVTCRFLCNTCREQIIMTGKGYNENTLWGDEGYCSSNRIFYTPLFFTPTVHLFVIPAGCPPDVRHEVVKSFSLFWHDIDSCVNKLRQALEWVVGGCATGRPASPAGKEKPVSEPTLHERIESFKKKNRKVREMLEAVKWIGNKGSHAGHELLVNEAWDAYELLEYALN